MQTYELARAGDPQFSAAESSRLATRKVRCRRVRRCCRRSAVMPRSRSRAATAPARRWLRHRQPLPSDGHGSDTTDAQHRRQPAQMVYDHSNFTRLRDAKRTEPGQRLPARIGQRLADHPHLGRLLQRAGAARNAGRRRSRRDRAEEAVRLRLQAPGSRPGADHRRARSPRPVRQRARQHHPGPQRTSRTPTRPWPRSPASRSRNLKGLPDDFQPALPDEPRDAERWVETRHRQQPGAAGRRNCRCKSAEADVGTARAGPLPDAVLQRQLRRPQDLGPTTTSTAPVPSADNDSHGPSARPDPARADLLRRRHPVAACARRWPPRDIAADELEQQKRAIDPQHPQRLPDAGGRHQRGRSTPSRPGLGAGRLRRLAGRPGSRHPHRARRAEQPAEPVPRAAGLRAGQVQLPAEPPDAGTGRRHARRRRTCRTSTAC